MLSATFPMYLPHTYPIIFPYFILYKLVGQVPFPSAPAFLSNTSTLVLQLNPVNLVVLFVSL